jgi:hypothetical protein
MRFNVADVRKCLKSFDFQTLFREHLGWDKHQARLDIPIDGSTYSLQAVAQKRGFTAYLCRSIPDRPTRLKIDHQVTKSAREHFIIYADQPAGQQIWQWVRREPGKPIASRDHRFDASGSGDALIQRLDQIAVDLAEEEQLALTDVTRKAKAAFDVDKVTKRFYERFKAEHAAFLKFIKGIKAQADLEWYTSLMLNRLMFVYFIQKKGFLDGDTNYLQNRMRQVQALQGKDKFQSFYRYFLIRLFHEGLGKHETERKFDREFEKLLGKVPYLNGGFFEVHQLEEQNPDIDIPDKAFEKLFAFFDEFSWHLDERPLREGNEINPDVVGYIFEKYINQKQMGAYYTKEDITEYISKNTIIPFLFDAAKKKCPIAFKPDSYLWRLLAGDPDRYIYAAVRHGVVRADGSIVEESELPDFVQKGLHDVSARMHDQRFNLGQAPKDDPIRLPTETWREYMYRRQRCLELREKLRRGEVHQINDLITLNLDIWQFARDAITSSEGPELLRAFWQAIEQVTVLDPTCGSGAFLFAALRILETLYSDCLAGMARFVADAASGNHHPEKFKDFKSVLAQIGQHPSERYFILKSIIIGNLFGVDIMEEAVEICKLRLFLKLVAQVDTADQIEPLPDIDFNIRAGNTLVGYVSLEEVRKSQKGKLGFAADDLARIEEDALAVDKAFQQFRAQQTRHGGKVTLKDKQELRRRLAKLDGELDHYLAGEYGIDPKKDKSFEAWKSSHQPFHWLVEFYGIMHRGGFDVIIGNPPYVEYSKVRQQYALLHYLTTSSGNLYGPCIERSFALLCEAGRFGFIVQAPLVSTQRMACVREVAHNSAGTLWYSTYDDRPSKLFDGMHHARLAIVLAERKTNVTPTVYTTRYHKWYAVERESLFQTLAYLTVSVSPSGVVPKFRTEDEVDIFRRLSHCPNRIGDTISPTETEHKIYYKITGVGHWFTFTHYPPKFWRDGVAGRSTRENCVSFATATQRDTVFCCLSSTLHYWVYQAFTNCRDFNPSDLRFLPLTPRLAEGADEFVSLSASLMTRLEETSDTGSGNYQVGGVVTFQKFKPKSGKLIVDQIDAELVKYYGFTDDELDFIINYDIKYRMGSDGAED